jgi:hypothetical protein
MKRVTSITATATASSRATKLSREPEPVPRSAERWGAIIGGIAAIGTNVLIPGLGLVVWGPIAAALAGAGAGGLTGGLVGALIGWGIPEEHAAEYEKGIREGGTVLGVTPRTDDDATYFENEWRTNYRGEHVYR